jgi:choline dehydrogenase-like flavoprotein
MVRIDTAETMNCATNKFTLGMTYLRAESAQIDAWEQIGNEGWNWESLMPYYKKSEYFQQPTASQTLRGASFDPATHGKSGPLAVGWTEDMMSQAVVSSINQTFETLGLPFNEEPNAGSMRGLTAFPKTVDRAENVREDAGRAYYWPVSKRPNLDIFLDSFVEKMIWHPVSKSTQDTKRTASGVVFVNRNGTRSTILANREVILSAGSLRSPVILEHSGVGNPS